MVDDIRKTTKPGKAERKVDPAHTQIDVSDFIGQRLRKYYDEVAKQPIPDRFIDLLDRLEAKASPKK